MNVIMHPANTIMRIYPLLAASAFWILTIVPLSELSAMTYFSDRMRSLPATFAGAHFVPDENVEGELIIEAQPRRISIPGLQRVLLCMHRTRSIKRSVECS
jgi:hypothetical protein